MSFRGTRRRDFGEIAHPRPVIFVDIDTLDVELLRSIPPTFVGQRAGTLLLRMPDPQTVDADETQRLRGLVERWQLGLRVAVLSQPIGSAPSVDVVRGDPLDGEEQAEMLARARAVELEALLEFGHAIWRPANYHYRLITGEHAEAYIKLGDAIREPRDATVLASWLHKHADHDVGQILDSGTLTPVAQALRAEATRAAVVLGPIATLDQYPRTGVDIDAILDRASGDPGRVIVMLSVSSSGSLLERVLGALARKGSSLEVAHLAVMVDKGEAPRDKRSIDVWTPLPGQAPLVRPGARDEIGCVLCRQPGKAAVVPINPFTFDAMLPTQLRPVVPDIIDPTENRALWEAAERNKALSVEHAAHTALQRYRSDKVPMGIVMRAPALLDDDRFRADLRLKIRQRQDEEEMSADADLVLVPEHEWKEEAFTRFWDAIRAAIAPQVDSPVPFPIAEDFPTSLGDLVRDASNILVFALGTVSGASIQRALVGVQHARASTEEQFDLHAFVVHARPATGREWQTIRNSYGRKGAQPQLRHGWKSILPDRSPLREERVLLRKLAPSDFNEHAETFLTSRLELCSGTYQGDRPDVLWGSTSESRLTPNAIYGQRLDAVTTYVAVGSAMAAALFQSGRTIPELRVFEVAAVARSYYDPLILASFLRWIRPHEAFWGWTATEASTTALHILDRAAISDRHILVPEMLLAAAQGKMTVEAAGVAVEVAKRLREDEDVPDPVRAALDIGLHLVDPEGLPRTEGVLTD